MSVIAVSAIVLIAFNILMWIIFLGKFNSIFSTDKIIEETRNAINEKIREANSVTDRNLRVLDGKIQEFNKVKAEAERRLAVLKRELETQRREKEFRASVNSGKPSRKYDLPYGVRKETPVQAELAFTEKTRSELGIGENVLPESHEAVAVNDGNDEGAEKDFLHKIPVVNPVVYRTENQIVPKKYFSRQVREYHEAGIPAEEIARLTGRSAQEVRLVLQML